MAAGVFGRRVNYDRVCTDCGFHKRDRRGDVDMCTRPVDLVSGDPRPARCVTARMVNGICGPEGRQFSPATAVRKGTNQPRRAMADA